MEFSKELPNVRAKGRANPMHAFFVSILSSSLMLRFWKNNEI